MTDVLKIAVERREALFKEIAALDRFVETAHALISLNASNPTRPAEVSNPTRPAQVSKPTPAPEFTPPLDTSETEPEPAIVEMDTVKQPEAQSRTEAFLRDLNAMPGKKAAQDGHATAQAAPASRQKANLG